MAKKNTDKPFADIEEGRIHQRLFGKGAKVSPSVNMPPYANSDDIAFAMRPKSENRGKDIHLPVEKALDREGRVKAKK